MMNVHKIMAAKLARAEHNRSTMARRECIDHAFIIEQIEIDEIEIDDAMLRAEIAQRMLRLL